MRLILIMVLISINTGFTLELPEILDRHLEALGGKKILLKVRSLSAYLTINFGGLTGQQVFMLKMPHMVYHREDFGVYSVAGGYDGIGSWNVDANGMVRRDNPEETKSMINSLFFQSYSYLLEDRLLGKSLYSSDTTLEKTHYYRIVLLPEGGDSLTVLVNSETFMIDYRIEYIGGLKMISKFSDFREIEGLKIPFHEEVFTPEAPYQVDGRIDSIKFNHDLPDSIFAAPGRNAKDYRFPEGADSLSIPAIIENRYVFLPVHLNGKGPFNFMLDTGAGLTFVNRKVADSLKLEISGDIPVRGIGGFGTIGFIPIDSFNIGELSLYLDRAVVFDFDEAQSEMVKNIDGVLGYDYFVRFPQKIDIRSQEIVIYNPETENVGISGHAMELEIYANVPVFQVPVNGEPLRLLLDLGARPGILITSSAPIYEKLAQATDDSSGGSAIIGIGGMQEVQITRIDSLSLAGIVLRDQKAVLTDDNSQLPFSDYVEGIIGLEILEKFVLYLDYQSRRVCFVSE